MIAGRGFYNAPIVNGTAMNKGVHVSFQVIVLSRYIPGVGLLDHIATLFLVFWGISTLFSIVAASIYIPIKKNVTGSHTLSMIYYL